MAVSHERAKTVLVTGAGGTLGTRLTARLLEAGWQVRALVLPGDRQGEALARAGCDVREGDVARDSSLAGLCEGIDTVYHLAAIILSPDVTAFARINLQGTANVVNAARAQPVRHFIYVSSASVTYPRRTPYGESKFAAEAVVTREHAFQHTIVRPTLVYERDGGMELNIFLRYLQRFPVVPFIGNGSALKRPVRSQDVVDGLFRLAGHPEAPGKLYNLSGGEAISILEFARLLLRLSHKSRPFVHLPVPLCTAVAEGLGWFMDQPPLTKSAIAGIIHDANLDPSLAIRDLGYSPMGVSEGLPLCFA